MQSPNFQVLGAPKCDKHGPFRPKDHQTLMTHDSWRCKWGVPARNFSDNMLSQLTIVLGTGNMWKNLYVFFHPSRPDARIIHETWRKNSENHGWICHHVTTCGEAAMSSQNCMLQEFAYITGHVVCFMNIRHWAFEVQTCSNHLGLWNMLL